MIPLYHFTAESNSLMRGVELLTCRANTCIIFTLIIYLLA